MSKTCGVFESFRNLQHKTRSINKINISKYKPSLTIALSEYIYIGNGASPISWQSMVGTWKYIGFYESHWNKKKV